MQVGDEELLHRWKVLAGDTSARPWTSNDVGGFLQLFRPHGVGLAAALEGVASASALLPRLLEVYRVTAPGWEEQDAYFVVKQPTPWPSADAHRATKDHFQKIRQIAEEIGNKDVLELLTPLPEITLAKGSAPWPPGPDDPESLVYECVTDFVASLSAKDAQALLLDEGVFYLACDYTLRNYILWPVYADSTRIQEPFAPYFELWKHAAVIRFTGHGRACTYAPSLVDHKT